MSQTQSGAQTPPKLPITIKQSTWKQWLAMLGCLAFVALGGWMIGRPETNAVIIGYASIAFFGLGLIMFPLNLVSPTTITVAQTGIEIKTVFKTRSFGWADIANFRIVKIHSNSMIGFDMLQNQQGSEVLRKTNRAIAGVDGAMPTGMVMSPKDLAALLNAARADWEAKQSHA